MLFLFAVWVGHRVSKVTKGCLHGLRAILGRNALFMFDAWQSGVSHLSYGDLCM
jgi:hypothetical protein